ncbi:hypothetical protein GTU99_03705 [Streptomyces sp. PRKS01-65]|nr:DUF6182 family protein [Streptomyces harenosi]NEY31321.1 hypothetical protein [Streptomyces harenosi]
MPSQQELREALDARVRAAGTPGPGAAAVAVLRSCELPRFAQSVLDFTVTLAPDTARTWLADHTRTVFLAGNPRNLASRLPPSFTSADGRIAWYAPGTGPRHRELRLLLRLVRGALPAGPPPPPYTVRVPHGAGAGAGLRRLTVATDGLTLPQYLVHLNHTLAEALLTGALDPGDRIAVEHVPHLHELPTRPAYLRVHEDTGRPGRLRAYACLGGPERGRDD